MRALIILGRLHEGTDGLPDDRPLRQRIIEDGFPDPLVVTEVEGRTVVLPREVTPEMVAIAGAAHACGVAEQLARTRGQEGRLASYRSYTLKNRFDRWVHLRLPEELRDEWDAAIPRHASWHSPAAEIVYPQGLDDEAKLVHGAAKPARFFPAQLIRYAELARLGLLGDAKDAEYRISTEQDRAKFKVEWHNFEDVVHGADSLDDIGAGIGLVVAQTLLERGVTSGVVASLLMDGYSLAATRKEHGKIPQITSAYQALLDRLQSAGLYDVLEYLPDADITD